MDTITISKFKATCLAALDRVKRTGRPLLVTRRGQPIAEVVPPRPPTSRRRRLGAMEGTGRISGDIVSPVVRPDEWEVLK